MDQRLQRKRDLETNIENCLGLQREYEEKLGFEKDPKEKRALKQGIEEQKELRAKYQSEFESLAQDINQDTLAKYLAHLIERNTYLKSARRDADSAPGLDQTRRGLYLAQS